jgi:predicted SnoaL-like aldol condensation-catalyzing enzyme
MAPTEIEKASLFVRGVAAGDADLAARHLDPVRYREHDPRVADGIAGLREHLAVPPPERRGPEIVRVLGEGNLVVVQSHGDVSGPEDAFDVFRFAGGLVVEHRRFASPGGPPNRSGHTQNDGPAAPDTGHDTEASKSVARSYSQAVHIDGAHDRVDAGQIVGRWGFPQTVPRQDASKNRNGML